MVDVAKAIGIPVEAELGKVGGKEDDLEAEADTNRIRKKQENSLKERAYPLWRSPLGQRTDSTPARRYWIRNAYPR